MGRRETHTFDLHLVSTLHMNLDPLSRLLLPRTSGRARAPLCLPLEHDRLLPLPDKPQLEIHPSPLSDKQAVDALLLARARQMRLRVRDQRRHGRLEVEDRRHGQMLVRRVRDMRGRLDRSGRGRGRVGEQSERCGRGWEGRVVLRRGGQRVERRARGRGSKSLVVGVGITLQGRWISKGQNQDREDGGRVPRVHSRVGPRPGSQKKERSVGAVVSSRAQHGELGSMNALTNEPVLSSSALPSSDISWSLSSIRECVVV